MIAVLNLTTAETWLLMGLLTLIAILAADGTDWFA